MASKKKEWEKKKECHVARLVRGERAHVLVAVVRAHHRGDLGRLDVVERVRHALPLALAQRRALTFNMVESQRSKIVSSVCDVIRRR